MTAPVNPSSATAFVGLRPRSARYVLLALIAVAAIFAINSGGARKVGVSGQGDVALYQAIDQRVLAGEAYYHAAAAEQRQRDYPLRPFVTVRFPTVAWLYQLSGGAGGLLTLMRLVAAVAMIAGVLRLRRELESKPLWLATSLLLASAIGVIVQADLIYWHEAWAGLLLTLSLACRSARHWWPSVAAGLAAVLFREIALPYLAVMAAIALLERQRMEAVGWGMAIVAAIAALILHAQAVAAVLLPGDGLSQGWGAGGGWRFDLVLLRETSLFVLLPKPLAGPLIALTLLGWAGWRSGFARRFTIALAVWLTLFLFIGRPVNFYWGLMLAPMLPLGLPLALLALRDLLRVAQGSSASVSSEATSPPRPDSTPFAE